MEDSRYDLLYKKLYGLFDDVTPLKKDCGAVCGRACCKGDAATGMRLFPHEKTALRTVENDGARFALCGGECSRGERPLSCRIFPFFPAIDDAGSVKVIVDPRAEAVCPLARHSEHIAFRRIFLRRMHAAANLLYAVPECRAFLREITEEIEDVQAVKARIEP